MIRKVFAVLMALTLIGCGGFVDITKTAKGFYSPTNPNDIEILKTVPTRSFDELATVSASKFDDDDVAKMHNAIRAKAAPLGANAVVLSHEGFYDDGDKMWAKGVALRYKDFKN